MGSGKALVAFSPLDRANGYEIAWKTASALFEAARHRNDLCFVYFISEGEDGPIKIGKAKDPVQRVRTMQTGNSRRLRIEHVIVGDLDIERYFHEIWEPFAVRSALNRNNASKPPGTEWFAPEIRERLFPLVKELSEAQAILLGERRLPKDLRPLVSEAHVLHGFAPYTREQIVKLGAKTGYVLSQNYGRGNGLSEI